MKRKNHNIPLGLVLIMVLFSFCGGYAQANKTKIAILPPISKGTASAMEKATVKKSLAEELNKTNKYEALVRSSIDMVVVVDKTFQSTGILSQKQRTEIGKSGASTICVSQITVKGATFNLKVSLVNIKTGKVTSSKEQLLTNKSADGIKAGCQKIVEALLSGTKSATTKSNTTTTPGANKSTDNAKTLRIKMVIVLPLVKTGKYKEIEKQSLRNSISRAFISTGKVETTMRKDVDELSKDQTFQSTGQFNSEQRAQVEKLTGAHIICVPKLTQQNSFVVIQIMLINVRTGEILSIAEQTMPLKPAKETDKGCKKLVAQFAEIIENNIPKPVPVRTKMALFPISVKEGKLAEKQRTLIMGLLQNGFTNNKYDIFTHEDIDKLVKEKEFKKTGTITEEQRANIIKLSSATVICIPQLSVKRDKYYIEINITDAYGKNLKTANELMLTRIDKDIELGCGRLITKLFGVENVKFEYIQNKGIDMIQIEDGFLMMGCTEEQKDCAKDEKPVHKVILSKYKISKTEITVAQFSKFIETSGYVSKSNWVKWCANEKLGSCNFPAAVSFEDASAFCQWAGGRLPTEAEWEYAARGARSSMNYIYSGSDTIDEVAWFSDNSANSAKPVAQKRPNEIGLYDMSGNMWEWCQDGYEAEYYKKSEEKDPKGSLLSTYFTLRGGSYDALNSSCRNSTRYAAKAKQYGDSFGFRLVVPSDIN